MCTFFLSIPEVGPFISTSMEPTVHTIITKFYNFILNLAFY